jgi:hypothetical protein
MGLRPILPPPSGSRLGLAAGSADTWSTGAAHARARSVGSLLTALLGDGASNRGSALRTEPARTATVRLVLSASAETISSHLRQYGEDAAANWILHCADEQLVRVCSVAEWLLYHGPHTASGSMLIAKALSLASVYVREGAPRELARTRRRRAESWEQPEIEGGWYLGRLPDHILAASFPFAYGVGDDARAYWETDSQRS